MPSSPRRNTRKTFCPHAEQLESRDLLAAAIITTESTRTGSANSAALGMSVSFNGQYVAYETSATNVVGSDDPNGTASDIYVRNRNTGRATAITLGGNAASTSPAISGNGRYVLFQSRASNLVGNDDNGTFTDVFYVDLLGGSRQLVSVNQNGVSTVGAASSFSAVSQVEGRRISDDGRFVVFQSEADNLVYNDGDFLIDVFRRDMFNGRTILVSGGVPDHAENIVISADGRFVAFQTPAGVYHRDIQGGRATLIGPGGFSPKISADGNVVVFETLVGIDPNDTNGQVDVYVRDLRKSAPVLVSADHNGRAANGASSRPSISDDGRFVVFESFASDLVTNDGDAGTSDSHKDVFLRDLAKGTTTLASLNLGGTQSATGESRAAQISYNGRFVVFESKATDLVVGFEHANSPNATDVYRFDTKTRQTTLLSAANKTTTKSANNTSFTPVISRDGRYGFFFSAATNIYPDDRNENQADIFVTPSQYRPTTPGIRLTQSAGSTQVTENGTVDAYTIVLTSAPAAPVTIRIISNAQVTTSVETVTFTPTNWYLPQKISVRAVDDTAAEGDHTGRIRHTVISNDFRYALLSVPDVRVEITDNDTATLRAIDAFFAIESTETAIRKPQTGSASKLRG